MRTRTTSDDTGVRPAGESAAGTPRWVKVSGIIALVLVLLLGVMMLVGDGPGGHGPGRHLGGEGSRRQTPPGDADDKKPPSRAPAPSGGHTGPPPGAEHGAPQP